MTLHSKLPVCMCESPVYICTSGQGAWGQGFDSDGYPGVKESSLRRYRKLLYCGDVYIPAAKPGVEDVDRVV